MKYRKNNGEIWDGPVCVLPDGRIITGPTYTRESVRVHPIIEEPAPQRARNDKGQLVGDDESTPDVNEAYTTKRVKRKDNGNS